MLDVRAARNSEGLSAGLWGFGIGPGGTAGTGAAWRSRPRSRADAGSCCFSNFRMVLLEQPTAPGMTGALAGQGLPTADRGVDIGGVQFEPATVPPRAVGGEQGRAAAEKGIEHDLAAAGAVPQRIGHQRHRLDRRMQCEKVAFGPGAAERVDAGVAPHIAAVATIAAELDMVLVRVPAMLEQEYELVLAAVERAHAGIVLGPHAQVLQLGIGAHAGGEQLAHVAPIHADEVERPVETEPGEEPESAGQELGELGLVHLARGHREFAVADRAEPSNMAI